MYIDIVQVNFPFLRFVSLDELIKILKKQVNGLS